MFVLPVRVEGPRGEPDLGPPRRATPATWTALTLIVALFLLETLARLALSYGWSFPGEGYVRAVTLASASMRLYPVGADAELFAPWQLWTYALLHEGWWHIIGNAIFLVVFGRALERWLGSAAFAMLLVLLAPLAGAIHLRAELPVPLVGASGAISGLMGVAWAMFPRNQVRCALVYYVIVIVGWIPFRLPMRALVIVFVLQDVLRMVLLREGSVAYHVHLMGILAGFALGKLLGQVQAWQARRG